MHCPSCGGQLPEGAKFCKHCGDAVAIQCRNCGSSVPAQANFCPSCRADLTESGASQSGSGPVRLEPREFARRLEGDILDGSGFFAWLTRRKEIEIETGNQALFLENGELVETLGPGRHKLKSLPSRIKELRRSNSLTVFLVERGDTTVDIAVDDVRTASEYPVTVYVELVFAIDEPERFVRSMLADRDAVSASTFGSILGRSIRDELQATLSRYEPDELYGNRELTQRLRQDIEEQCRSTLERNGLELVELRSFEYDDDRDELREGRKQVEIRKEHEEIKDEHAELDRRDRERTTNDRVHEEGERVRRRTAEQSADQEIETQQIDHEQTKDDMHRRHEHKAEREQVEHKEELKTTRTESEVERQDTEFEQDIKEIERLQDIKKRKDMDSLDIDEREQEMEMRREQHRTEVEKERLEARDDVDLETLASMEEAADDVAELAKMARAEGLSPEQLDALGAQESDELAKARQEAKKAEYERKRVEDQEKFREELTEMAEDSMDRMQETTESAMNNTAETGKAAADDTSDNVIVSGSDGGSDSGDTTIVQGGGGGGGEASPDNETSADSTSGDTSEGAVCPNCGTGISTGDDFCLNCGAGI
jgi:uncharacterized membrane protein YqiK